VGPHDSKWHIKWPQQSYVCFRGFEPDQTWKQYAIAAYIVPAPDDHDKNLTLFVDVLAAPERSPPISKPVSEFEGATGRLGIDPYGGPPGFPADTPPALRQIHLDENVHITIVTTASRFTGASIAGLVVGAMGVFVFTVALRHWLGERRKFEEEARA